MNDRRRTSSVERHTSNLDRLVDEIGSATLSVTKVIAQKKQGHRVSVFIDEEFAFGLFDEVAVRHGIRAGATIDETLLQDVLRDEQAASGKQIALRYISYRMRSTAEVRRRLAKEGTSDETIDSVVDHLHELGMLDDAAFAKAFARDAAIGRKWGPRRIANGLRQAGVNAQHVEDALAEVRHLLEDEGLIEKLAAKRWGQLSAVDDLMKRKKRVYDYLLRRGFDFDEVRRAVDHLLRQSDDREA